ncbi:MAG: presenilin family intramembrane aspartyl protease [archaeon]
MFFSELSLFLGAQILGVYVGFSLINMGYTYVQDTGASVSSFLISFTIATLVLVLMLKFLKSHLFFKGLLAFLIFVGAETVFAVFIWEGAALLLAIALVVLRFKLPNVFMQNLVMVIAIAGIGANLGTLFSVPAVLIILAVLCIYDVVAVYKTKHMVSLFKGMVSKGVPFSLIVPESIGDVRINVKDAVPGEGRFLMLGTGDVAFPVIFAVAALQVGLMSSVAVVAGALVGLLTIHLLLVSKKTGAIPALPPITFFSVIFFLISLYFNGGL